MLALPIDAEVPRIREVVDRVGACVVVAPPGAGKTTRVPPALLDAGRCVVLQPRRVAARSLARRIAGERGWSEGGEVGWHVRFERRFGPDTRLIVATEGVLTARLQGDPLLSDVATVVLDEFHERSVHADLALALVREARRARDDLRVVVMSATLDPGPVAAYLDGCPVVEAEGRPHPVTIEHAPHVSLAEGVRRALERSDGHVLAFLPGVREIERATRDLADVAARGIAVLPLHGSLPAEAQDAALAPSDGRKVVLATNLAETSVTVEGVGAVVDSGLHRVPRYDPSRGLDRLRTERVPHDSAEQRAGRAGRTGPGFALRLWDPRDDRPARREPELGRVDLAPTVLDVLAWGGDPARFPWFESPPAARFEAAVDLLRALDAVDAAGLVTDLGRALRRLPVHPRLARLVASDGGSDRACAAAAWVAEARRPSGDGRTTRSDLLSLADRIDRAPGPVRRAWRQIRDAAGAAGLVANAAAGDDDRFLRAVLAAWPDRVAGRREPGSSRVLLSSGVGAVLDATSGVRDAAFLVAVDVAAPGRDAREARIRLASAIEAEWLETDDVTVEHALEGDTVRARRVRRVGALTLGSAPVEPDPDVASRMLAGALAARPAGDRDAVLFRRLRFAGITIDLPALHAAACAGRTTVPEFRPAEWLSPDERSALDRLAPESIPVPSGRQARLDYREDGDVVLSIKLQELFGLADTPRVGPDATPVTVELLAPNGRTVQTTRDLESFWDRGYPEVRRELRGRYPKHPWPEDPWTALPTSRTHRRGRDG